MSKKLGEFRVYYRPHAEARLLSPRLGLIDALRLDGKIRRAREPQIEAGLERLSIVVDDCHFRRWESAASLVGVCFDAGCASFSVDFLNVTAAAAAAEKYLEAARELNKASPVVQAAERRACELIAAGEPYTSPTWRARLAAFLRAFRGAAAEALRVIF